MSNITSPNCTGNRALQKDRPSPDFILGELREAVLAEGEAIGSLDDEELWMLGDRIQELLEQLGTLLAGNQESGDRDTLLARLVEVRSQREANEQMLRQQLGRTGRSIDQAALGLRAVQAYFGRGPKHEIFVKKKC